MQKSKYQEDKLLAETFAKWLDENFYDELAKQELILGWYRVNGEKLQKQGQDVIIVKTVNEEMVIDEKAALQYINKNISTFAFEIKNQNSGAKGWLYNDSLKTEYYLLAWPNSKVDGNGEMCVNDYSDFLNSEVMLINKKAIIELLEENNLSEVIINQKINDYITKSNKNNNRFELAKGIKLNFNFTLYEKPINIIINKELLKSKAIFYDVVGMICPHCGNQLRKRKGQHGEFIGCSNYPNCKYTRHMIRI